MLVLSRKIGEEVIICNDIPVTKGDMTGSSVRTGTDAPDDVRLYEFGGWQEQPAEHAFVCEW